MGLIKTFKVGVQPVIDGVVAKGRGQYAIAIKKTNGNILLDKGKLNFISRKPLIFIRGIISFFENCMLSSKMLAYSADYFDNEEKNAGDEEFLSKEEWLNKQDRIKAENTHGWLIFSGILFLMLIAIIGFFILPVLISSLFFDNAGDNSWFWFNVVEGCSRILLSILYLVIFKSLGGMFSKFRHYQAAGNKAVNCFEAGKELSFGNVKNSSKFHPRSAEYILFLSIIICSIALMFIKMDNFFVALLIRMLVLVLSINVAYEISRLFGMFNGKISRTIVMIFGMWIEFFTLTEPDDMEIYIAITAVKNSMTEGL